jgi:cytochrome c oxidase cbb3-type subunit 2
MPAYPWLEMNAANAEDIEAKLRALRALGVPYSDPEIAGAKALLKDKTEMDALIAYLQVLGTALKPQAR